MTDPSFPSASVLFLLLLSLSLFIDPNLGLALSDVVIDRGPGTMDR
jgi:hypothetical protein